MLLIHCLLTQCTNSKFIPCKPLRTPVGNLMHVMSLGLGHLILLNKKMTKQLFSLIIIAMFSYPLAVLRTDCKISD